MNAMNLSLPRGNRWRAGSLVALASLALVLGGCADMNPNVRSAGIGAGVGAAAGALLGHGRGAAIGAGVGALGGYVWSQYMQNKEAEMRQATAGTGVQVMQTQDNRLQLQIPSDVSFATNSSTIEPNLRPILDTFAQGLGQQPGLEVSIVGYTDSTGTPAINNPLSLARANSVRDYLIGRGVNPQRIQTSGLGDSNPIASNSTAEGRARNRRVEIFLADRGAQAAAQQAPAGPAPLGTPIGTPIR